MTEHPTPFDAAPDAELGAILRTHLEGPAPEAFTARMRGAVIQADRAESVEILSRWARPGLVAAGLAAAMLLWVLVSRDDAAPTRTPAAHELIVGQPASSEVLMATVLEGR